MNGRLAAGGRAANRPGLNMPSEPLSDVGLHGAQPIYLTNASCESAHGSAALFNALGLKPGTSAGGFYPLTEDEAVYIADDAAAFNHATLLFGYSVLLDGQKWLAPAVEFHYRDRHDPGAPLTDDAAAFARAFCAEIAAAMAKDGGRILLELDGGPAHHTVNLFFPFPTARRHRTWKQWRRHVNALVDAAYQNANRTPHRVASQ